MLSRPLYFDAHATTPCDPLVVAAMAPFLTDTFGNASSLHHPFGWAARQAVETARAHVASLAGARLRDVVFTSGATEANNLALKGCVEGSPDPAHVVTVVTEHSAVLDPCRWLEEQGTLVTYLRVDHDGLVSPGDLEAALMPTTRLVSVMAANNEIARRKAKVPLAMQQHGGGHEGGLRSGTLNVPGIVGFGEACRLAGERLAVDSARLTDLRNRLWTMLQAALPDIHLRGALQPRLPHNLNIGFGDCSSRDLVLALDDVAVSPGAACASTSAEPSHVLRALGLSDEEAKSSLRFGLLRTTTEDEVDYVVRRVVDVVTALRR